MPGPKRLRSFSKYEAAIRRLGRFRVVSDMPGEGSVLIALGFSEKPSEGDAVVPPPLGPVSGFNANGREVVRKDLPKEPESRMIWTKWLDWHGQEHSGTQWRTYEVYPREIIPPPEEELTVLRSQGRLVLASRVLDVAVDTEIAIIHVLNLFLEVLGELTIVTPALDSPPELRVHRLNWRVLPPGEYPFARAKGELQTVLDNLDEATRHVVEERVRIITQCKPDFMAVGLGGFRDYVVFGFQAKKVYVLESPWLGNATYVFKSDWRELSALTKKQILEGSLQEARLIHNDRWYRAIRQLIGSL